MFDKIKAAAGGKEILAVIENLPVSANGFFLTAEQMTALEGALGASETVASQLATANENLQTAQNDLAAANAKVTEKENAIAALNSKVADLEGKEGEAKIVAPADPEPKAPAAAAKYKTAFDDL